MRIVLELKTGDKPLYFAGVSFVHQTEDNVCIVFENGDNICVKSSDLIILLVMQ